MINECNFGNSRPSYSSKALASRVCLPCSLLFRDDFEFPCPVATSDVVLPADAPQFFGSVGM